MNIFYTWGRTDFGWKRNFYFKDNQIYDFVRIYCYEKECEVYFHKDYEAIFSDAFSAFFAAHQIKFSI